MSNDWTFTMYFVELCTYYPKLFQQCSNLENINVILFNGPFHLFAFH